MSLFDPHKVYNQKKKVSKKGQIIEKKIIPIINAPLNQYEIKRVREYLLSTGQIKNINVYSKNVTEIHTIDNIPLNTVPATIDLSVIYNLSKSQLQYLIPEGERIKYFQIVIGLTQIEVQNFSSSLSGYQTLTCLNNRTEPTNSSVTNASYNLVYTMQNNTRCQFNITSSVPRYFLYNNVNQYPYLQTFVGSALV